MNYEVSTNTEVGKISCDFASAKAYLASQLEQYQNCVFTEDSKKFAKATVAELRKQKKEFSDRVKEVKAEYMKPFDNFKKQADELIAMYDEPINFINDQVEAFEEKRIEQKREAIRERYTQIFVGLEEAVPLNKIYNEKWDNATYRIDDIGIELRDWRDQIIMSIQTIKDTETDIYEQAVKSYLDDFNLHRALQMVSDDKRRKAEILAREQERLQREAEERIRREEREKIEAERRLQEELARAEEEKLKAVEEARNEVVEALVPEETDEPVLEYEYTIKLTREAQKKLEMYMDSVGIEYTLMPF